MQNILKLPSINSQITAEQITAELKNCTVNVMYIHVQLKFLLFIYCFFFYNGESYVFKCE